MFSYSPHQQQHLDPRIHNTMYTTMYSLIAVLVFLTLHLISSIAIRETSNQKMI